MGELELLKDFYTNVKAMREAQRAYFKTRSDYALSQAKNLEYEVDKTIGVLDDTGQGDLFSEEPARALGLPLAPVPQPIETAPRDGTPILVQDQVYGWLETHWVKGLKCWAGRATHPTRWMPKPQGEEVQS